MAEATKPPSHPSDAPPTGARAPSEAKPAAKAPAAPAAGASGPAPEKRAGAPSPVKASTGGDAPAASKKPGPELKSAKGTKKDAEIDLNASLSFWERLNPANWFRKESPARWVEKGESLLEAGNRNQALIAFHKAIAMDPSHSPAHRGLGRVTMLKGGPANFEAALVHYKEAARLDPFDDRVYRATAILYEKLGKPAQAVAERKKLGALKTLQTDPKNPVANNNVGVLFMQQEQVERAIECFKKAIDSSSKYDAAHRNLAATYFVMATREKDEAKRAGLLQSASASIASAIRITASVPSLLTQARIQMASGDSNKALESVAQAESLEPHNPAVHMVKRTALEKLGRMADAQVAHEAFEAYDKAKRGGAA